MEVLTGDAQGAFRDALREEAAVWLGRHADCCQGFYEMMCHQLTVSDASSRHDGMFCATLCRLSCQAAGGDWRRAVRAAVAVELLYHWFSIHQDIERHVSSAGEGAAVWQRWGDAQAINTGDGLFAQALVIALEASDDAQTRLLLTRELCSASLAFAEEQERALDWTGQETAAEVEAVAMRQMGALGGLSAWAGAILAGSDEGTRQALRAFGAELGTAWQLAADRTASATTQEGLSPSRKSRLDLARRHGESAISLLQGLELPAEGQNRLEVFVRGIVG